MVNLTDAKNTYRELDSKGYLNQFQYDNQEKEGIN